MNRKSIPFLVAIVLVCLVMAVSGVFAFTGAVRAEKFANRQIWSQPFSAAESMKALDFTGDGQEDLFVQNSEKVTVFDQDGRVIWDFPYSFPKTTLGDVDGDGTEDIIVAHLSTGTSLDVIIKGQVQTIAESMPIGLPSRVILMRYPSGPQIVVADTSASLVGLSTTGEIMWSGSAGTEEIRGMDDGRIGGDIYMAVASHDGSVNVIDYQGQTTWRVGSEQLRRMRAFDLNSDGNSEIITGGEYGALVVYNATDGTILFNKSLGQAVSEVRVVELNGDPSAREFVVGGKDGGVWAFSFDGSTAHQMWSGSLSDKVTEISGLDIDEDGKEEAVIGAESGEVAIFTEGGARNNLPRHASGITRIDIGKFNGERLVIVADGSNVTANRVQFSSLPGFQYTPLIVGVVVSAVILLIAAILASIPPKPEMKVSIQDKSRESLEAGRRMLKESIADVERLRKAGEVTGDAYLARLKQLRADLAENEAAFKAAGYPIRIETFQCPNCGGTLELGMDKCEYCGQVILS